MKWNCADEQLMNATSLMAEDTIEPDFELFSSDSGSVRRFHTPRRPDSYSFFPIFSTNGADAISAAAAESSLASTLFVHI